MTKQQIDEQLRGLLVRAVIELEYAQARMGNDRSFTRGQTVQEIRRTLGWKSFSSRLSA